MSGSVVSLTLSFARRAQRVNHKSYEKLAENNVEDLDFAHEASNFTPV